MRTAYIEGEGLLTEHGYYIPEENLKAAVRALARIVEWIEALPPETRARLEALAGQVTDRREETQ